MPKTISAGLAAHVAGEVTTLASCWKIVRRDGEAFHFTDHDRDLIIDGATYKAATGYKRSAITSDATLAVDNLDVDGILEDTALKPSELRGGLFDHATIEIFLVNWANLSQGKLPLRKGWLGEVRQLPSGTFHAEMRGLAQALQQQIVAAYTPTCRADLGDDKCKAVISASNGAVTGVTDNRQFASTLSGFGTGYFAEGILVWQTGANAGQAMEVKAYTEPGAFALFLPMPFPVAIGDTFQVYPGCDKTIATCKTKFDNVVNFRGFPHVPGNDAVLTYADAH